MKVALTIIMVALCMSFRVKGQTDTTETIDLFDEISMTEDDSVSLIPDKFLFTQKIFWGKKGLMRNFDRFELTPEKRQRELKLRRFMLTSHQIMGFATLGGMIAQGIVGARLYNGETRLRDTHGALAAYVNITYFTTASLTLFAPPKALDERKGYSSIKLHKALAIVHFTAMIATNILAGAAESNSSARPYHRAAAYTAFGAFATSMIVIKF